MTIRKLIVEASDIVEVIRRWEISIPDGIDCPEDFAQEVAEDNPPDETEQVYVEVQTEFSITDEWGNDQDSPMYGVPPEGEE
jgi:hypothetical protein